MMVNQKTYLKEIKNKCPYCEHINMDLITYQIYNSPAQKFIGSFIMSEIETELGVLDCFGYCDNCGKRYEKKIGIKNSRITNIVI